MGDFNPPTTADFAWSEAREAANRLRQLELRVITLENTLGRLISHLGLFLPEDENDGKRKT